MDKHFISDSLLFDIWCWRDAPLETAVRQLANAGINYATMTIDGLHYSAAGHAAKVVALRARILAELGY